MATGVEVFRWKDNGAPSIGGECVIRKSVSKHVYASQISRVGVGTNRSTRGALSSPKDGIPRSFVNKVDTYLRRAGYK